MSQRSPQPPTPPSAAEEGETPLRHSPQEHEQPRNHAKSIWQRSDLRADFELRASWQSDSHDWQSTQSPGVSLKPIEIVGGLSVPRFTSLLRIEAGSEYQLRYHNGGTEILVLDGTLNFGQQSQPKKTASNHTGLAPTELQADSTKTGSTPATTSPVQTAPTIAKMIAKTGQYLRFPIGSHEIPRSDAGCTLFMKVGQISELDVVHRNIDTLHNDNWLPGPAEGTEVLPLHLHGTKSVLMIRWLEPVFFKPHLDPQGEEIFVVSGQLHDANGSYLPGSWIRNPVPAWQAWGGTSGTVIYYKNGHFPE